MRTRRSLFRPNADRWFQNCGMVVRRGWSSLRAVVVQRAVTLNQPATSGEARVRKPTLLSSRQTAHSRTTYLVKRFSALCAIRTAKLLLRTTFSGSRASSPLTTRGIFGISEDDESMNATRLKTTAFTIIEMLIVIGILFLLGAIAYFVAAPVRESSRAAICLSNLNQISLAFRQYRLNHKGKTAIPGVESTAKELGLPVSSYELELRDQLPKTVWHCPSDPNPEWTAPGMPRPSYSWNAMPDNRKIGPYPSFTKMVAERGEEYPLMVCWHHDNTSPLRKGAAVFHIVRLNGKVEKVRALPEKQYWEW